MISEEKARNIAIGILIGIVIGQLMGLYWMNYYLNEMKRVGIEPRDYIIEYLNRELNSHYEYEEWHRQATPVYISGVEYFENGTMISPPLCIGTACPWNFTGVIRK